MKKFRPSWWLLLTALFLTGSLSGCSTTESVLEGSKRATLSLYDKMAAPVTRVKRAKPDGLTKKVLLLPLVDQAGLGPAKVEEMTKTLIALLEKGKGIRIMKSETPLPSAEKAESPRYGITIDSDRAKRAEEMGMNVLLTVTLNPFEFQKTKSGIWPFRSVKWEVEMSISATALDIINGTLYLTHTESDRFRLLEDLMEWEEEEEEELRRNIDGAKLEKTLARLLADEASAIREALIHEPWSGRVLSADGQDLVISGGRDVGLREGKILDVYQKGEAIRSVDGKSVYLLGSKVGEIEILTVRETDSSAVPRTEGAYKAGQVIRLKR